MNSATGAKARNTCPMLRSEYLVPDAMRLGEAAIKDSK